MLSMYAIWVYVHFKSSWESRPPGRQSELHSSKSMCQEPVCRESWWQRILIACKVLFASLCNQDRHIYEAMPFHPPFCSVDPHYRYTPLLGVWKFKVHVTLSVISACFKVLPWTSPLFWLASDYVLTKLNAATACLTSRYPQREDFEILSML